MKLFLTSIFSAVGDKLLELIEKNPQELVVAFVPTASNPYRKEKPWIENDRNKLLELGFNVQNIDLAVENETSLKAKLDKCDLIFIAGGNATYLMQKCRESGFIRSLNELLQKKIYVGSSAGSIIVGPSIEPFKDEELKELPADFKIDSFDGAGIVDYIILPHYNQEKYLSENKHIIETFGPKYKIHPLNDNQAFIVQSGESRLVSVVEVKNAS